MIRSLSLVALLLLATSAYADDSAPHVRFLTICTGGDCKVVKQEASDAGKLLTENATEGALAPEGSDPAAACTGSEKVDVCLANVFQHNLEAYRAALLREHLDAYVVLTLRADPQGISGSAVAFTNAGGPWNLEVTMRPVMIDGTNSGPANEISRDSRLFFDTTLPDKIHGLTVRKGRFTYVTADDEKITWEGIGLLPR